IHNASLFNTNHFRHLHPCFLESYETSTSKDLRTSTILQAAKLTLHPRTCRAIPQVGLRLLYITGCYGTRWEKWRKVALTSENKVS
ncbi:hypothetical protein N301_05441, partial [Charadrius vociferus]